METLRGTIETITFRNDDTGFTVLRLMPESSPMAVPCVGVLPTLEKGVTVELKGSWETHGKFGRQFAVSAYSIITPTTAEGILRLLCSGYIANIGETRARRIVETFGAATLDILDNQPKRLLEVPGIGKKILAKISESWQSQKQVRDLVLFLQEFGVTLNMAYKIHKAYGAGARETISANPYVLVEDIWGVGFKRADQIAQKMGFDHASYKRIRAGLVHLLDEASGDGHCFLPRVELVERAVTLLEVERDLVVYSLDHTALERLLIGDDDRVYLPFLYNTEVKVGALLSKRLADPQAVRPLDPDAFAAWLDAYCTRSNWQPDPKQVLACRSALGSGMFVLTGGPGTGKTTTLQILVSYLREQGRTVSLAAPTGRAAQRMGTVAGMRAKTIHRLLEFRPGGRGFTFARNAANPLDAEVVIVDEVSMIDILLMASLLDALPLRAHFIMVGDSNQLPSVGPGNVLADLIACRAVPHVELTTVFRQAAQSAIVVNAHAIIAGRTPGFANAKTDDCFFVAEEDPQRCVDALVELVCSRLPKRYGLDPLTEIQVLSPMHRGPLGTQNLNRLLQHELNRSPRRLLRGETVYCVGDKVMQVQNNYDTDVFNGDIGLVADLVGDDGLLVDFDGNRVTYRGADLEQLVHAYCISIHKSQGCEFRAVVIPLTTQHYVMLQRNLIYTALTRARRLCVFVGSLRALRIAVNNNQARTRWSRLAQRIG